MKSKKQNTGYTLMEIVVVLAIFIILALLSAAFIIQGFRSTTFGYEQNTAVQNAKKIINAMIQELREARRSDAGDYLLDIVEEQNFSFYSDIDSDENIEKVRYYIDGDTFKKGLIEPTGDPLEYLVSNEIIIEIAQYINNQAETAFTYYDTNNNLIADPAADKDDIRLVKVYLKINVTPEKAPNDYIVEMDIHIRNLKDNL